MTPPIEGDTMSAPTSEPSTLYSKLLGETAVISWQELQPFFARGAVLRVEGTLDLVGVAAALAEDDKRKIAQWLASGELRKLEVLDAEDYLARDPLLWAVVVAPWVLVQERLVAPVLH